ncbi:hypothetical protein OD917_17265 [Flavobacterium sp. SH_e]|uniref:FeoB-associated Cys-rich membrane protein n=2 Tax=Flavobacterium TaxID=237 RepID=UPI0021E4754C|nr:FeoB-associated Cys-rich membrane protein [Flavobacterium sp. SH_e]MCV2486683.1 hypothetical protein [Flavobacterium sp. SH_e]
MKNNFNYLLLIKILIMDINWSIIAIVALLVIILVVLTIRKNQREKKKLENLLNNDFKKVEKKRVDPDDAANEK